MILSISRSHLVCSESVGVIIQHCSVWGFHIHCPQQYSMLAAAWSYPWTSSIPTYPFKKMPEPQTMISIPRNFLNICVLNRFIMANGRW